MLSQSDGGPVNWAKILRSKRIDITTSANQTLLVAVPKQLLYHFCGVDHLSRFLKSDMHSVPGSKIQYLRLPAHACEHTGIKFVIAWMQRAAIAGACGEGMPGQLRAPNDYFVAVTVVRALRVLGLFPDAARVERFVSKVVLKRPLGQGEIRRCEEELPKNCKFVRWIYQDR